MTKVAVTGASGFVGGYLLPKLLRHNFEVQVLDFGGGKYPRGVSVTKGNLLSGKGLNEFLNGAGVVIHLAGQVLPGKTSMYEGNTESTANLLAACRKLPIKKFIFSSTVAVYGNSRDKVFKETDVCKPDTEYGVSKLAAEKIITDWSEKTGGDAVIFRFFSIYGPGNRKGVIYNICHDFIEKGEITVFGSGKQRRDLVYVEDVTELLDMAVLNDLNGIYNVGTGKYYSILDLVSVLEDVSGRRCKITFKKAESEKVDEILYSIKKLKQDFGWIPDTKLESGMKEVYKYLLKNEK